MWRPFSESIDEVAIPEAAAHAPILIIHAWEDWSGVSRPLDHALKALSLEFQDRVAFRSLDTEDPENHDFLTRLKVMSLPALILYARGKEPRLIASRRSNELRKLLQSLVYDWEAVTRGAGDARTQMS
ncbi:MAG TPA: thioredoxin family protein [Planctomycetota bacterium]